ncbi:unnamed protein product, partial [Rotaria magnacalcarata]
IASKRFLKLYHPKDSFNTFCPISSWNEFLFKGFLKWILANG